MLERYTLPAPSHGVGFQPDHMELKELLWFRMYPDGFKLLKALAEDMGVSQADVVQFVTKEVERWNMLPKLLQHGLDVVDSGRRIKTSVRLVPSVRQFLLDARVRYPEYSLADIIETMVRSYARGRNDDGRPPFLLS